uniref:Uncharacterized protein n=1 Tax=Chelonoidis abingdonii TaxID=106734 RepID=A0A8C0GBE9_CHEAB
WKHSPLDYVGWGCLHCQVVSCNDQVSNILHLITSFFLADLSQGCCCIPANMGGKLSKKGLNVAYEKPIAHVVEATGRPEEREDACPAAESMGPTTEKRHKDSQVPADEREDKEGGRVPAVGVEEICESEPKQLDLVPNEDCKPPCTFILLSKCLIVPSCSFNPTLWTTSLQLAHTLS